MKGRYKLFLIFILIINFIIIGNISVFANTSDFISGITEGYSNQPYHVEKENNRKFIIRPEADQVGTSYDYIELIFRSVNTLPADSNDIMMYDKDGAVVTGGDNDTNIDWVDNGEGDLKVKLSISFLQGLNKSIYKIKLGGLDFIDIELRSVRPAPVIEANLSKYSHYGNLSSDRIYYVKKEASKEAYGSFFISNSYNIDILRYRIEKMNSANDYTGDFSLMSNTPINKLNQINDTWGGQGISGVSDITTWDTYWKIKDNIPLKIEEELKFLDNIEHLNSRIIRVVAKNYGAKQATARNYYIVIDDQEPEIKALNQNGNEKLEKKFDTFQTRRPQLKVNISDDVSGVGGTQDIKAKIIPMPTGNDQDTLPDENDFTNAEQMDVIALTERDNNGKQMATIVPYSELGEGEYAVMITAVDQAGNSSDDDTNLDNDVDAPYIFYLNIDQTKPTISNVSVNNKIIDVDVNEGEAQAVSADKLELYFESYGTEDLIYGIRYLGEAGPDDDTEWFVILSDQISYVTQYLRTDFANHTGVGGQFSDAQGPKNGAYELFIIADEEGIDETKIIAINNKLTSGTNGFVSDEIANGPLDSASIIGELIEEAKSEESKVKRSYEKFTIQVDGNPPEYKADSLHYFKSYPDGKTKLIAGQNETISKGQPVFEVTLLNASNINRNDIEIYFINQSDERTLSGNVIMPPTVNETDNEHVITFQPVINLTPGVYNLKISATDEFGNTTVEDQILFVDVFKIISTSGGGRIDFSILSGDRLDINESSSLEIIIPPDLDPTKTLKISVNGNIIVQQSKIVDDREKDYDDPSRYRDPNYLDNPTYYTDQFYQSDAFDLMFFDNKHRIIIFSRLPLPSGKNEVEVELINDGVPIIDSVEFMVDNYRKGFGFGRLLVE